MQALTHLNKDDRIIKYVQYPLLVCISTVKTKTPVLKKLRVD
jgi:hypothetical protein